MEVYIITVTDYDGAVFELADTSRENAIRRAGYLEMEYAYVNVSDTPIKIICENKEKLKNMEIKKRLWGIKGGCVVFPEDWIVLEGLGKPEECKYVGVVEYRRIIYDCVIPYFIFFSVVPINQLSAKEEEHILEECQKAYPQLKELKPVHGLPSVGIHPIHEGDASSTEEAVLIRFWKED